MTYFEFNLISLFTAFSSNSSVDRSDCFDKNLSDRRSTELLELKAVNKEIKLNSKYVNECKGSLANRRLKENKLLKLIEVFEADISAKELEIASKMIPR